MRGAKKKKGEGSGKTEAPLSNDILNIWKDRIDPVIKPLHFYPEYVKDALKP